MISPSRNGEIRLATITALFVAAPVLLTLNALFHPDVNTPAEAGESVVQNPATWYWVHAAGAVGATAFSAVGLQLVRLGSIWRRKLMMAAGVMTSLGAWFFTVEQASHGLLMSAAARSGENSEVAARLWKTFLDMGETTPIETGTMLFALGLLGLAVDLLRRSPVPRWTGGSLLAFIVLSVAADTSGALWLVFGALYTVPLAVLGAAAARTASPNELERTGR